MPPGHADGVERQMPQAWIKKLVEVEHCDFAPSRVVLHNDAAKPIGDVIFNAHPKLQKPAEILGLLNMLNILAYRPLYAHRRR